MPKTFSNVLKLRIAYQIFIKLYINRKIMKLKLRILDAYINLYLKFQNFLILFGTTNNFVKYVILLKLQFYSATVYVSKIYTVEPPNMNTLYRNNLFIVIKNYSPNLGPVIIRNKLHIVISYIFCKSHLNKLTST